MIVEDKKARACMRDQIMRRGVFSISVWSVTVLIMGFLLSCVDPIKLDTFSDKSVMKKKSENALSLSTVPKHSDKIVFSWKKIRNATSYYIYKLKNSTGTLASKLSPDDIVGPNTTQYTIFPAKKDMRNTHYVMVVARNSDGKALVTSEIIEGKTFGKPRVQSFHRQATFYNVTFQWALVEGANKYAVERKAGNDSSYTRMNKPLVQNTSENWTFVDENVIQESTYFYKVIAYAMSGDTVIAESSNEFSVTTPKQEAPFPVENFAASKNVYFDRVLLVWDEPKKLTGFEATKLLYAIQRREKSADNADEFSEIKAEMSSSELKNPNDPDLNFDVVFKERSEKSLVYQDKSVDVNKLYEYKIVATYVVDKKRGEPGRPSAAVEGAVIPQVSNVLAQYITSGISSGTSSGVRVQWVMPPDFVGTAEVHRSKGGYRVFDNITKDKSIKGNQYVDVTTTLKTMYGYKVRLIPSIFDADDNLIVPTLLNKGVFSATANYEHQKAKGYNFNFAISRNKKDMLKFSWNTPVNISEDISVNAKDFSIERLKNDHEFEEVDLSTEPAKVSETWSTELNVLDPTAFQHAFYRLVWENNKVISRSQVVQGDILRAPEHVTATKGEYAKYIVVEWRPSFGAEKYQIEFRKQDSKNTDSWTVHTIDGANFLLPQNGNSGIQTVNIVPPKNKKSAFRGIEYDIRIVAIGGTDESADKAESTIVQGHTFGPAGMNVKATKNASTDKITITWNAVYGADEYLILRKNSDEEYEIAKISSEGNKKKYTYADKVNNNLTTDVPNLNKKQFTTYEYSIIPKKNGIKSSMASSINTGYLLPTSVTRVQASDVDYVSNTGIYIARHAAAISKYNSKEDILNINRKNGISYATKITWESVAAQKYYIYRMDFNELTNFWRKIGERDAKEKLVFFDTKSLILREYRAMYWVVACNLVDNKQYCDESLRGDISSPQNTLLSKNLHFQKFNAGAQTENINTMSKAANVDVGSRWITLREYLNWSLAVIGEGVYDLDDDSSKTDYGIKRDSWKLVVSFSMDNYSLGAKALNIGDDNIRKARKSTELVVNSNDGLSGTYSEACKRYDGSCATTDSKRLGTYIGNEKDISVDSPYGKAKLMLSGTAKKKSGWGGYYIAVENGLDYNFDNGTITFSWLDKVDIIIISKNFNKGTPGPLNPYVTPIRFNRSYRDFLIAVYGNGR